MKKSKRGRKALNLPRVPVQLTLAAARRQVFRDRRLRKQSRGSVKSRLLREFGDGE